MNQYQYTERKVPALLKQSVGESSVKSLNSDLMEVVLNGQRVVVPTAEAYNRLVAKVARLEQRVLNTESRSSQALRKASE
jgi:hypothetical protein